LQALNEFYSSILELPALIVKERKLIVKVGSSDLVFVETKGSEPFYHFAINIPSNKIEDAKTWLIGKVKLLWMEDYKNDIAEFVNRARSIYFLILLEIFLS
jgi:catechol-2,3-dioxygenase